MTPIITEKDARSLKAEDVVLCYGRTSGEQHSSQISLMQFGYHRDSALEFHPIYSIHWDIYDDGDIPYFSIEQDHPNARATFFYSDGKAVWDHGCMMFEPYYDYDDIRVFTPDHGEIDNNKCCWKLDSDEIQKHIYPLRLKQKWQLGHEYRNDPDSAQFGALIGGIK